MDPFEHILTANERFAAEFTPGDLLPAPRLKIAIVACMDARIDPPRALGLHPGDAHIIRNAGGHLVEALRSIAISQQMLGTEAVAIIRHTRCGLLAPNDDAIRQRVHDNLGFNAVAMNFLTFADLEQAVRDDLHTYAQSPIVRHDIPVRGFVYEVETGRIREVCRSG